MCNCTAYLYDKFGNETIVPYTTPSVPVAENVTTSAFNVVQQPGGGAVTAPIDLSTRPARASCGIEIIAGKILDTLHNALFRITSPVDQQGK